MDKLYIIVSGAARNGKNLFSTLLKERLALKFPHLTYDEFALADKLKLELRPVVQDLWGIDIFNCIPEEKELIRPLMVIHGKMKRIRTQGRHWINQLVPKLEASTANVNTIVDCRYDVYENDEVSWAQKELKGILVHISLFNTVKTPGGSISVPQKPANEDEAENNPKLQAKANYRISWEKQPNGNYEPLYPIVDKFIDFISDKFN